MRWANLLLAAWLALAPGAAARAQSQAVPEYVMKATYLYNFMVFADWPPQEAGNPEGPLNLCIFGPDNFGSALANLEGKNVNGRHLAVQRIGSLSGLRKCHLLFVTEREAGNMASIQNSIGDAPVLTVADSPAASGAAILLSVEGKRLVFDINTQRTRRAGIILSSKVLQLARSTN